MGGAGFLFSLRIGKMIPPLHPFYKEKGGFPNSAKFKNKCPFPFLCTCNYTDFPKKVTTKICLFW